MKTMIEPTTRTLEVPGAVLTYDVRPNGASTEPTLMLIGLPMGAAGFNTLASYFTDRTVVTYDPRGGDRSTREDDSTPTTPDDHADDVHRLIAELGGGPVDLFGSSGGAVVGLALATRHAEDVRTLVAHEPPTAQVLPDREEALAAVRAMHETYQRNGFGPAMVRFISLVSVQGPIPPDFADQEFPDPATLGMPADDDGSRNDILFGQTLLGLTHYQPDFDALRRTSTRIVLAAGVESKLILASRATYAIAKKLGQDVVVFPSHHSGFMGGEYGQAGEPEMFAANLREVLDEA